MKESRYFSLYLPEYKDDIDISEISDNFNRLDSGLEAMLIKKDITTNTINDISVFPPFWSVKNPHDFDVVIYDRTFEKEITVEAGKTYKAQVDHGTKLNIHVQGLHELEFTYYISTEQAIEAAKGSDYKLTQITSEEYSASYKLQVKPKGSEEYIDVPASAVINIPKDKVVKSGDVKTCQTDGVPEGFKKGDKYIDLVIDNDEGSHIYIPVNTLVDNKAEGISYSNTTSKMKATNVQSAIDEVAETVFKQTEIVPVSSVANTVTIPSDVVGDFAAVKMIGGKTVKTKNLLSTPYSSPSGHKMATNVVVTYGDDGIITLNGTPAIDTGTFMLIQNNDKLKSANYKVILNTTKKINVLFKLFNGSTEVAALLDNVCDVGTNIFNVNVPSVEYTEIRFFIRPKISYGTYNNDVVKIMLTDDLSVDQFEPYFEGLHSAPVESISVKGKNLISGLNNLEEKTNNGITFTPVYDNYGNLLYINLKGTCGSSQSKYMIPLNSDAFTWIGKKMSFKATPNSEKDEVMFRLELNEVPWTAYGMTWNTTSKSKDVIQSFTSENVTLSVRVNPNTVCNDVKVYPMISNDDGEYSPYTESTTVSLTELTKNLPDYGCSAGDVYNYIDFEKMEYHHNVGSVDLGTLQWITRSSDGLTYDSDYASSDRKAPSDNSSLANIISDIYTTSSRSSVLTNNNQISMATTKAICIYDNTIDSSATRPIDKFIGHIVNYELATPEVIDLSDILAPFAVEPNGTITFENKYGLDVPNTVLYKKEVLA